MARFFLLSALIFLISSNALAQNDQPSEPESGLHVATSSPFYLWNEPDRPRSDLLMPLASFLLPGLDQWIEGQDTYGAAYSGVALAGLIYSVRVNTQRFESKKDENGEIDEAQEEKDAEFEQKNVELRKIQLGLLAYQGAGGMSAWHSFQSAARSRKAQGQYLFLKKEESPADVLTAPFDFSYLKRSSTQIPLIIGASLNLLIANSEPEEDSDIVKSKFTKDDAFYTATYSYNAGTHEEAIFRGWLLPASMEYMGDPFLANVFTSVLFAGAHMNTVSTPIAQLLLGYHMGNVTIDNDWTIGEAVFIHTWWDIMAFATSYHFEKKKDDEQQMKMPVFWFPPFEIYF